MFLKKHIIQIIFICILNVWYFSSKGQPDTINGLSFWLKADWGVIYDNGNKVSIWNDASGNGINFTQNNNTLQPLFISSIDSLNNKPAIRFGNSAMTTIQDSGIDIATIFILANYNSDNFLNYAGLLTKISNTGDSNFFLVGTQGGTSFYNSILGTNLFMNDSQTYNFAPLKRPKIIYGFLNTPVSWDSIMIGWDRSWPGRFWKGDIYEIIAFNRKLVIDEASKVKEYLMNKYAPPINLPNDTILTSLCPFTIKPQGYYTSYLWNDGSTNDSLVINHSGNYKITATDIFGRQSVDSIYIQYPVQTFQNTYFLCNQDSIVLETGLSYPDFSFQWQNGDTNSYFVVYHPGQYYVYITDSLGCTFFSDTINVLNDTFSFENALNDSLFICIGDSLKVNNVSAISYLWSTNETTSFILPQTTQWYYVTLTNANNCKLIDSCYVTIKGVKPQPYIQKNNLCTNSPTIYTGYSSGNIQQWEWIFKDTIIQFGQQTNFLYQQPGIYQTILHVIDSNTCEGFVTSIDTIYLPPRAAFNYFEGCSGQNSTFESISQSQDSINAYYWYIDSIPYQGSLLTINLNPSSYIIKHIITTEHGCTDSTIQTLVINNLTPIEPADANFPNNGINLTENNIIFSWNNYNQRSLIEISYLSDFSNIAFRSPITFDNSYSYSSFFPDTTVYWRIWTYNACNDSISSQHYYFTNYNCSSVESLALWLKSDSGIVKDNNNYVSEWHDISGNNLVFSQIDNNLKPIFISTVDSFNYKPSIYFNHSKLTLNQNINIGTFFIVANYHNDIFNDYSGLLTRESVVDGVSDFLVVGNNASTFFYNSIVGENFFINNVQTLDFAPLKRLKIIKGIVTPSVDWDDLTIGHDRENSGRFWNGDVTEAIVYEQNLTQEEANIVQTYLMDKYAPPVLLPEDTILTSLCPFTIVPTGYYTSYQWNTGETNDTLIVTKTGKYVVTATDIFGRISKDSILVTFPPTFNSDNVFVCLGDSVLVSSPVGNLFDYQWSNGNDKSYSYVKDEGWYFITITDSQACTSIDSFFVKIDSLPTWSLFNQDSVTLCKGNVIEIESFPYNLTSYFWSPTNDATSSTIVNQTDWYSVQVQDIHQCNRKDSIYVSVSGVVPIADFTFSHTCQGQNTYFNDESLSLDTSAINSWMWIVNGDTLNNQNPTYLFSNYGNYLVKLIVNTELNCEQSVDKIVPVYPLPNPNFNVYHNCNNHNSFFSSQSTIPEGQIDHLTWLWGDGSFSFDLDTVHVYSNPGIYEVKLIAESEQGCIDSISKNIEIKPSPVAGFDVSSSCKNNPTFFVDTSKTLNVVNPIMQWKWSFGDGDISEHQHPTHIYNNEGTYIVRLFVKTLNGCFDSTSQAIVVSSKPYANFSIDSACLEQPMHITDLSTISNGQIVDWKWYASSIFFSNEQNPIFYPQQEGQLPITLIITSNTNCTDTMVKDIIVHPKPFINFEVNPSYGTAPLIVNFNNLSEPGTSYWKFGDETYSTLIHPTHIYQDTGTFTVWLTQTSIHGCVDSMAKSVLVVPNLTDLAIEKIQYSFDNYFITVTVLLSNLGTLPIENPILTLTIDGKTSISEIVYDTLFSGNKLYYTLNSKIPIIENNIDYICVKATISNNPIEIDYNNNENCISLTNTEQLFNFYPNPASSTLTVLLHTIEEQEANIEISELSGKILISKKIKLPSGINKLNIEIADFAEGIYLLRIKTKNNTFVNSFIKGK